jgi:hypothetical protein
MASVYGNNSDMLAKLMAVPGASDLMELSLTTVNADYEKWVAQTMEGCGMLELRDGSGIELTPGETHHMMACRVSEALGAFMQHNLPQPRSICLTFRRSGGLAQLDFNHRSAGQHGLQHDKGLG